MGNEVIYARKYHWRYKRVVAWPGKYRIRMYEGSVTTTVFEVLKPDSANQIDENEAHVAPQSEHPLAKVPLAASRFRTLYEHLKKSTRNLRKK